MCSTEFVACDTAFLSGESNTTGAVKMLLFRLFDLFPADSVFPTFNTLINTTRANPTDMLTILRDTRCSIQITVTNEVPRTKLDRIKL
ncbi:hypothetical protein C491_15207 [Natronococcus amylolyticus DSM 10524]|uniref:Uncharacterized protein n=1 Tax=Natronococcus amylolyticus DSM 10524 TaxID=1227497 RepID=L9X3W2_9EURY|nr:hypothetical protein C491_15207 [Natronococcus amylolyticus DSM 10524]